jgi:hypothetical protein
MRLDSNRRKWANHAMRIATKTRPAWEVWIPCRYHPSKVSNPTFAPLLRSHPRKLHANEMQTKPCNLD